MEAVMVHGSLDQSISPYKSSYFKKFHRNQTRSDAFWLSQSSQPPLLPLPASARRLSKKSKSPKKEGKKSKDVAKVISKCEMGDIFSGSAVFSPPPSSLPLPTFTMRPKLSCQAAGVDAGATDGLRRLLRLR
ncbi:hypothetical protein AAHA92_33246 [Salvia divinorum]|uniref:Uncharacterized protein n=1 Tax=Salvia divinorum TaxID=28513 RepID=A0ABD1FNC8_SALDI